MTVQALDADIAQQARAYQNTLTKPLNSLGKLEDIACWFAERQGKVIPDALKPHIAVFAGDHGVCEEGVSAFPSVVTGEMVKNFSAGGAAINVLSKQAGASLSIVDVGVLVDTSGIANVKQANIKRATNNILKEAAMSEDEVNLAMQVGRKEASLAIQNGANLLIAGDMGIGNTTSSACLIALFTQEQARKIVGRGTGIDDHTHEHKIKVVEQAVQRVQTNNSPTSKYLAEVGGLEIAAMAGFYLEAAKQSVPVIIDGFISTAAALVTKSIKKEAGNWMLASHISQESGHSLALEHLNLEPLVDFKMRLGEGSGAALILPILQSAVALHREMATFEAADVSTKKS